jgi:hypothetical protein
MDAVVEICRRERIYRRFLACADALVGLGALVPTVAIRHVSATWLAITMPVLVVVVNKIQCLYDPDDMIVNQSTVNEWRSVIEASAMGAIAAYLLLCRPLTGQSHPGGMRIFAALWISLAVLSVFRRIVARRVARYLAPPERLIVVGHQDGSSELAKRFSDLPGVELIGTVRSDQLHASINDLGALADRLLVCRLGDSLAVAGDRFEDALGGFGPHVRPRVLSQVSIQARMSALCARTERWAARLSFLLVSSANQRSTRFSHELEVGGEVQVKARVGGEPAPDLGRLVGGAVVEHEIDVQVLGDVLVDGLRNLWSSIARWRLCNWPITFPVVRLSAAYRLEVPCRL